ncbi:MAG: hypothetical protein GEV06_04730 [Luteitalea sp.]|nr:hypothetical protein [Luteitalea sp.]
MSILGGVAEVLNELHHAWALIGGLAVSVRVEPRTTRDVDIAVAVADDAAAESLIHDLVLRGYQVHAALEQRTSGRLATIRLTPYGQDPEAGIVVDLLFASSGIESEVVAAAEEIEIQQGLTVPVARAGHLVAMKLLSASPQRPDDARDLIFLLRDISPAELRRARDAIALVEQRRYNRGTSLGALLDDILAGRGI